MDGKSLTRGAAALMVMTTAFATKAHADLYIPLPDGYLVIRDPLIIVGAIAIVVALFWLATGGFSNSYDSAPPSRPSPHDYDQEAAIARAKARALDAQAAYDDSRAKAALKREELQEVEDFLNEQRSKRAGKSARR